MMFHAFTPTQYWVRAFGAAVFIINRFPSTVRDLDSHLHVILGYSEFHKGYRCLDSSIGRVYISRHVVFNESMFLFKPVPTSISSPSDSSSFTNIGIFEKWVDTPNSLPSSVDPSTSSLLLFPSTSTNPSVTENDITVNDNVAVLPGNDTTVYALVLENIVNVIENLVNESVAPLVSTLEIDTIEPVHLDNVKHGVLTEGICSVPVHGITIDTVDQAPILNNSDSHSKKILSCPPAACQGRDFSQPTSPCMVRLIKSRLRFKSVHTQESIINHVDIVVDDLSSSNTGLHVIAHSGPVSLSQSQLARPNCRIQ
ncbi:hypothetical protein NE237_031356 [Protea cynaroides]|uniref:Retroviral polymerase SH3-like domain-containing protein n=1 Tax=Protea cynaroides TaxID=273540 RepID=A0A9Q0R2D2_9MAGN|nr:hypothetical protein NE237_031356 [Protea cynaroides]